VFVRRRHSAGFGGLQPALPIDGSGSTDLRMSSAGASRRSTKFHRDRDIGPIHGPEPHKRIPRILHLVDYCPRAPRRAARRARGPARHLRVPLPCEARCRSVDIADLRLGRGCGRLSDPRLTCGLDEMRSAPASEDCLRFVVPEAGAGRRVSLPRHLRTRGATRRGPAGCARRSGVRGRVWIWRSSGAVATGRYWVISVRGAVLDAYLADL